MYSMANPEKPRKEPYAVEVETGEEYYWCDCGLTASPPWCDGAHKGTPHEPIMFIAKKTETVYLCGCAKSKNKPYCDGTHQEL
ncbi:MAG TPA: CDGSH iron-sulfur domain-containing protein [Rhodospirillales bacterium]|nr:CDGSH iron-sulfur domain-containing protein [Rhodospirillales bacterium]